MNRQKLTDEPQDRLDVANVVQNCPMSCSWIFGACVEDIEMRNNLE